MSENPRGLASGLRERLKRLAGCQTAFDEPLSRHSAMGTGGPADAVCRAQNRKGLADLLALLADERLAWVVLGYGTNVLFQDSGLRGIAVKLEGGLREMEAQGVLLKAGAGAPLAGLLETAVSKGLGGLEFATGIPGTVGGALVGNAGTAKEWIGSLVDAVELMASDGRAKVIGPDEAGFEYRSSRLASLGEVVLGATFRLGARSRFEATAMMSRYASARKGQPLDQANCGCIFKNPPGFSAGKLIDEAGFKGQRAGGARISERHANFIINSGAAKTSDVLELIERVRTGVKEKTGQALDLEIVVLDESGRRAGRTGQTGRTGSG